MRRDALLLASSLPLVMLLATLPAVATPTASVIPSSIDSMTTGEVLVSASGLGGTEMRLTLWADVDGDGIVDAEDYAVWRDIVPDNVAEWSPVMAADEDPTPGAIAISARAFTVFNYPYTVGAYVWEVEDPSDGSFDRVPFAVTQTVGAQSVSGYVDDGFGSPAAGAIVVLVPAQEECDALEYSVMADANGDWWIELPADLECALRLAVAAGPGSVGSFFDGAPLELTGSGSQTGIDLELFAGTHRLQGWLRYDGGPRDSEGVPGVLLFADSDDGFAVAITEFDGRYEFMVEAGDWEVIPDSELHLALQGAVYDDEVWVEVSVAGPVTAPDLLAAAANAFVHGTLYDDAFVPQAGRLVEAWENWPCAAGCMASSAFTWPDGSFVLGLLAQDSPATTGYNLSPEDPLAGLVARNENVTLSSGQTLSGLDLEHVTPTATISGKVSNLQGEPIGDLCLRGEAWGPQSYSSRARVECDGSYTLPVVDGDWNVRFEMDDLGGPLLGLDETSVQRQVTVAGASLNGADLILGGWLEAPTLVRLEPAAGPAGSHLLLTGFGLPDPSAARITFDGVAATVIEARPDLGRVVVMVPAGLTPGSVEVVIEDLDRGMASEPSCFQFDGGSAGNACLLGGNVTEYGGSSPVFGTLVVALDEEGDQFLGAARTDPAGSWTLSLEQAPADHVLIFLPPAGYPHAWGMQPGVACGATADHDFVGGVPVSGMVTDEYGEPIPSVSVEADGTFSMSFTLTDSDGQFMLWLVPGDQVSLDYLAPWGSHIINDRSDFLTVSVPTSLPQVQLSSGSLFVGRVVDEKGAGIHAFVDASHREGGALSGGTDAATCSGLFAIAMPPGEHMLEIEPTGLENFDQPTEVRWVGVFADMHAEFDFAVYSDDLLPVDAALPRFVREITRSGAVGQAILFDAENLAGTGVDVMFTAAGGGTVPGDGTGWDVERGLLGTRVPATAVSGPVFLRVGAADSRSHLFTVEPGPYDAGAYTLSGNVTASGTPLEDVIIALLLPEGAGGDCDDDDDALIHDYALTDAGGAYSLQHPGGDLILVYFPPDATMLAPIMTELLGENGNRSGFDQALVPGVPVHVRALAGSPPSPVRNAYVEIEGDIYELRLTDANGEATAWVAPGEYELFLEGPHGSRLLPLSTVATAPVDLGDVSFSDGPFVSGRVAIHDGSDLSDVIAEAWGSTEPWEDFFEVTPDDDGVYHGPVGLGQPYDLWVEVPRDDVANLRKPVPNGLLQDTILYPTDLLGPAGLVDGTVRDAASSSPLGWFFVNAFHDEGGSPSVDGGWAETCPDGSYSMKLATGSYFLQAMPNDMGSPWLFGWHSPSSAGSFCDLDAESVSVVEGATVSGIDVDLDQRSQASGQVRLYRDPSGGSGVSVSGGRLGSCTVGAWTDGAGFYSVELPAGSGYQVTASPPPGYFGPEQCWESDQGCESWTPLNVPPGVGVGGISFLFGDAPGEVSLDWAQLRVERGAGGQITLIFEKRHESEIIDGYNVYGGVQGSWSTAAYADCFVDPWSIPDNGDGTLSYSFPPAAGSEWYLVSSSNFIGESPLGNGRTPSGSCGAAP